MKNVILLKHEMFDYHVNIPFTVSLFMIYVSIKLILRKTFVKYVFMGPTQKHTIITEWPIILLK